MKGEFHSNVTTFLYLFIFPCFGTAVEKKKSKIRQENISMGDLFKDIQPVYLIDSLLNLLKKRSESDATDGKSVPQQKTKHFLHLCLLPFLSDVAFHAHIETKDIYKKKKTNHDPHYRVFHIGNRSECFIATTINYYSLVIIKPFVLENTHHPI